MSDTRIHVRSWVWVFMAIEIAGLMMLALLHPSSPTVILAAGDSGGGTIDPPAMSEHERVMASRVWTFVNERAETQGLVGDSLFQYSGFTRQGDVVILEFMDGERDISNVGLDKSSEQIVFIEGNTAIPSMTSSVSLPTGPSLGHTGFAHVVGASRLTANDEGDLGAVEFSIFWPSDAPTSRASVCSVRVRSRDGAIVQRVVPVQGPLADSSRGAIVDVELEGELDAASLPDVTCVPWEGKGLVSTSTPTLSRQAPVANAPSPFGPNTAYLSGQLSWQGPPNVGLFKCYARVDDGRGNVIAEGVTVHMGAHDPAAGKQVDSWVALELKGDVANAEYSSSIVCEPTHELDPEIRD